MKKILKNTNITNKKKIINFFLYTKIVNKYQKHKEKLQKETHEKYQNLSEKENEKRQKKIQDRYQNRFEEEGEKKYQYHREPNKNLFEEDKKMFSIEKSLFST